MRVSAALSALIPALVALFSLEGLTLGLPIARAQAPDAWPESWAAARKAYDAGNFEEALQKFRAHPLVHASYYYNLGNVYYRQGQFGIALAHFDRALQLDPLDSDARHNQELTLDALKRTSGRTDWDPASSWIESLADRIPLDEVRAVLGMVAFLTVLLWIRPYLRTRSIRAAFLHPAALIGLCAFLATGFLFLAQRLSEARPPAVCAERLVVKSGPGEQFLELGWLDPGIRIRMLGGAANGWRQARVALGRGEVTIGWVPESGLLIF